MIILGIDPGITGALAFYDPSCSDRVDAYDMPVAAKAIDGRNLHALISRHVPSRAVIEFVHAMPRQGVSSTFAFGRSFGTAIGVLEAMMLPVFYVSPQRWKRYYGLDSDGEKSRRSALDLFPQSAALFARKKDHHRAEAALIARWLHSVRPD